MIRDMTNGSPSKLILFYTLPMLLSVACQQIYNIADSVIAGQFIGVDALAAVGASYPITVVFLAFATGSGIGCSVVVSQLFGAKNFTRLKTAISTSILSLIIFSVFLSIMGSLICRPLMSLIQTPTNILEDSVLYLQIYIFGFFFLFLYNASNSIFTALGDSNTPLYFLIFSSVLNIILDLVFVISFKMGVAGVAWATFIAQSIAAVLSLVTLCLRIRRIPTDQKPARFDLSILSSICRYGIPSILQQSFISIGQVFVQGLINSFGSDVVAGYSAAFKIHTFSVTSITTTSNATSGFTSQNIGAGKFERVKLGYRASLLIGLIFSAVMSCVILLFSKQLLSLFADLEDASTVLLSGRSFLFFTAPAYFVVALKIITDGVLRGSGNMRAFMISTFSDLILRVGLSYLFAPFFGYFGIWVTYPIGWIVGMAVALLIYRRTKLSDYEKLRIK